MNALDIREQQVDPAGSGTPASVAPEVSPEPMDAAGAEPVVVAGAEPGAAVADAAEHGANGSARGQSVGQETEATAAPADTQFSRDEEFAMFADSGEFGDVAALMEQYLSSPEHDYKTLSYGDVMEGILMHIDRDEILVDIGSKAEAIIPAKEYSDLTPEERAELKVGDRVLVFVVQPENPEGHPVVSINRARQEKSWRKLQEIYDNNEVIEAEVTNYNKGGLLVNLDGVRGFVPASQVTEIRGGDDASKQADMARLIGHTLPLKIIEINRHRNRLILSERQAIQERRDVMKERLIAELKEGEVRRGRVSSICDFGAFVDIGGADGLVHLSELSWSRVRHPSEVLKVGQEVDVYVLGVNPQEKKIALSIKRTQAEPWSRVASKYEVGQLVKGTVTQLANFGAFARIEDGIEGLIHISELADERITHPRQAVHEGQELLLRIIRIDPQRRRMGLSLRRALDTPESELEAVFGEGIIEFRDRVIEEVRASLAAEGIEYHPEQARPTEVAPTSGIPGAIGPEADVENVTEPSAEDPSEAMAAEVGREEAPSPRETFQMPPVERPAPKRRERRAERAPQPDLDLGDEEMSAMAMAFAMAGAQAGLIEDTADAVTREDELDTTVSENEGSNENDSDELDKAAGEELDEVAGEELEEVAGADETEEGEADNDDNDDDEADEDDGDDDDDDDPDDDDDAATNK
jgi:small subunit ribosomal protein S1